MAVRGSERAVLLINVAVDPSQDLAILSLNHKVAFTRNTVSERKPYPNLGSKILVASVLKKYRR